MNMIDSAFLCLDIGTCGVRGIAHRVRNATIDRSAYYSIDNFDTVFALKSVIDELEQKIGMRFDNAYITGNFGPSLFKLSPQNTVWPTDHKIAPNDIKSQIGKIDIPDGFYPMHIIPLRYDTPKIRNMLSPVGHTDRQLVSAFSVLCFDSEYMNKIQELLRHAHIQPAAFYAPHFLEHAAFSSVQEPIMFIDMGAENTTVSIWTPRGLVWYDAPAIGGNDLTSTISTNLAISFAESERIKRNVANLKSNDMARFSPADSAYAFSCADVNDIVIPFYTDLIQQIQTNAAPQIEKYKPTQIILTGGGVNIDGLVDMLANVFDLPIHVGTQDVIVRALADYIWHTQEPHRKKYLARIARVQRFTDKISNIFHIKKRKPKQKIVPIMPSTLCFDMRAPETYTMFKSAGINAIHVDIMDGLYVDTIAGGLDELRQIRASWDGHLHVHLMTEAPTEWARGAIDAGADTIILSTNTAGLRAAVQNVRAAKRRVGIAINPDSPISLLKTILRDLDEVMVMAVEPGAAGQKFDASVLKKITALAATRKKYGLKFVISVDGGITDDVAKLCWNAGADVLVSGSYLGKATDFPLAVQSLLKK
ncbi:MAG: ribulose-phosphate 3-epimerase [Alphaproteobacteria bacterium]|nr:ribulose-phosphate 3-epimerase [Alphaproteobacteria bacterium]